jgi:HlyD family secretion protein
VKAAEAALRQAEPNLESARVKQAHDEEELGRVRKAYQGNAVPESELDMAEMAYRQSSEALRSARIDTEIASFELEQARAALLRSRPRETEETTPTAAADNTTPKSAQLSIENGNGAHEPNGWNFPIYSPINGRVLRVLQESSAVVMPGTPLVELGDPGDLEVEIDVLSRDAVKIKPGDLVLLEHWGGQKPLEGRVRTIEPSGFTKISTLGVEEQRVWVIADLDAPKDQRQTLGDGFRVEARIVIDEAKDVLRVPTSSLFRIGDDYAVFRVDGDVVHEQKVKVGRQNGMEAEILAGLKQGDTIVLHPSDQIDDGVKVRQR